MLGSMRRHGALELLVVLPDGAKRLIPAAWTEPGRRRRAAEAVTGRGRWARRRTCWACLCWFRLFPPAAPAAGSRLHENRLPGRMIVQPVQLSLLPDQVPAPLPELTGQLPGPQVEAAVTLLAGLIARASRGRRRRAEAAMSESGKITASHLSGAAVIYVRQSTLIQVERNTESTARQYDLVNRARQLGWPREAIRVIDGDLGISGSVTGQRDGFEGMVAEVALGQVGIILALEASRLARDNAAWYRLLDLAGMCDTLVADADGVYHPALFNDRLISGHEGHHGRI